MATGNSRAFWYLNPAEFGGACIPNDTGFTWNIIAVFREPATNRKNAVPMQAETLDADGLPTIMAKIAAAVKAEGLVRDYNVTVVVEDVFNVRSV